MTDTTIDALAYGSDIPRSMRQYVTRRLAQWLVSAVGLNRTGALATEIVQATNPVARIATPYGTLLCKAGHGRLVWRAETFFTEEPDTVAWLNSICPGDVLWDVGANVGLYSIYAAKFRRCKVVAFEPEAQNYALLMENIALNRAPVVASNAALSDQCGFGNLHVRYITKGGAFNTFGDEATQSAALAKRDDGISQMSYGVTGDAAAAAGLPSPTHIKIDVDGNEPKVIDGCGALLRSTQLRSVLVELNLDAAKDRLVPGLLENYGFHRELYGLGKPSTRRASPMVNMVFER